MYVGFVDEDNDILIRSMDRGEFIFLRNARIFHHQLFALMSAEGPSISASTKIFPFPLSMSGGDIYIKATTYIDVEAQPDVRDVVEHLMNACKDMEQQLRAKSSGLVMATSLPKSS